MRTLASLDHLGLDDLLKHVRMDGECLVWASFVRGGTRPAWWVKNEQWPVRRSIWALTREKLPASTVRISVKCGSPLCVHPDHLVIHSRSVELKGLHRDIAFKAKIAATKRAQSTTTQEIAAQVRSSDKPIAVVAQELGIGYEVAAKIRRHERWADYVTPFAGLGGRS